MPGTKKRKGDDTHMWGSHPAAASGRRKGGSSARRGNTSGGGGSGGGSPIDEKKADAMFDEWCEADNPDAASMEGASRGGMTCVFIPALRGTVRLAGVGLL